MKGGGKKRNSGPEALSLPNEAASTGGVDSLAAPSGGKDQTQEEKEQGDELQGPEEGEPSAGAGEEAEEDAEDGEDTVDEDEAPADDDAATERPKLDDGFYEIEAIRRKRVRKGQLQYLIKWRGWPEVANTWEPLENLQSCSDVIDAFEESLRSGKHRKRKRKHGTPHTQPKKKQQRSSIAAYDLTGVEINDVSETVKSVPPNKSSFTDLHPVPQSAHEVDNNEDIKNLETAKQTNVENGYGNVCQRTDNSIDGNEYDPKLSEFKTTMFTNEANMDKFAIHFEEAKASEDDGPVDGVSKVDCIEPFQSNRRTGAKRRKSGSVKRFKNESFLCEPVVTHNARTRSGASGSRVQPPRTGNPGLPGENSSSRNGVDGFRNASHITRIIKPIGYSASVSNDIQDVLVTFTAMRSDGTEVTVDNKFLKANNPLLLINFYEQHLRYSLTSMDRGIDGECV